MEYQLFFRGLIGKGFSLLKNTVLISRTSVPALDQLPSKMPTQKHERKKMHSVFFHKSKQPLHKADVAWCHTNHTNKNDHHIKSKVSEGFMSS